MNTNFDVDTKSKRIETKKNSLINEEKDLINDEENLLDEIKNNVPNEASKESEITVGTEIKDTIDEKGLIEENITQFNVNDNNQEAEFIPIENVPKKLVQPNKISIIKKTESKTADTIEVSNELNNNMIQVDLTTLPLKNKNNANNGIEIQSLPTVEDFKAKIVDKIREQTGSSIL